MAKTRNRVTRVLKMYSAIDLPSTLKHDAQMQKPISPPTTVSSPSDKESVIAVMQTATPGADEDEDEDEDRVARSPQATATQRRRKHGRRRDDTSVYDPNQSLDERRRLRKGYRELRKTVIESRQTLLKPSDTGLLDVVGNVNALYKDVRQATEAVLDSELLIVAGEMTYQKVWNFKLGHGVNFDLDEYVLQLKRSLNAGRRVNNNADGSDDDEDDAEADMEAWRKMGSLASGVLLRPATHRFLVEQAEPKPRRAAHTRSVGNGLLRNKEDLVRPEVLSKDSIQETANSTSTIVMTIKALMELCEGPVNLFELILNPASFSQSVENMFYLSFLVRDGLVTIGEDERGVPMASLVKRPDPESPNFEEELREHRRLVDEGQKQAIFELDYGSWRALIEAYDIKESIITTRPTTEVAATSSWSWYG